MPSLILDTNLLVLLVVGLTAEPMIGRHKRTRQYDRDAFRLLLTTVDRFTAIVVTGHALAKTSNLLRQCAEPLKSRLARRLGSLIDDAAEKTASARIAVARGEYVRLGFTDAGLLEAQIDGLLS